MRTPTFPPLLIPLLLLSGCATHAEWRGAPRTSSRVCTPSRGPAPRGVVFVADGAGNFQATSRTLRQVVCEEGVPLAVETVPWSHGWLRVFADHLDRGNLCRQGRLLARSVSCFRQHHPDCPVFLVGHSAGASVVLIAADHLPPGGVERIVLLAPAVSICRELRGALCCARAGVDVFYSDRDWGYLGFLVGVAGTSDRRWAPAAGQIGFWPCEWGCSPGANAPGGALCERALLGKLRQYPWHPDQSWTGHYGGHFGSHQPNYLRHFVLPLLDPAAARHGS